MNLIPQTLTKDEQVYLSLEGLFESYGYRKFKMRKFEQYSLYEEYKSFLTSEYVLTFHSPDGKLMALRPDVTLSIVKNTRADETNTDKVFYRENVYRMDRHTKEFREIPQAGVELIGQVDAIATLEIVRMAKESLSLIDEHSILCLSHMGFIEGLLTACNVTSADTRSRVLSCIASQNVHDLRDLLGEAVPSAEWMEDLSDVLSSQGSYTDTLTLARKIAVNGQMNEALNELETIGKSLADLDMADGIRLDFTMQNDLSYYNGVLMQGYVEKYPGILLTGGRYDRLLTKFHKNLSAVGFALSLGDLNSCYPNRPDDDADVLLLYSAGVSAEKVLAKAESLRREGKRVRLATAAPRQFTAQTVIDLREEGSLC
ncbi:MAG: ATP phosphoribosyltransferase regulatory subunit [Clostridia bacterium]|nr:ATP phosphoribosyltransferase regulatory subunit [Clostridia bacterium]MBQ8382938.1 ATP phosphoribosyltransferase regulatory subunit [Clostridia bacterium]